jgi:threonylcarbamoyladenosine tRNA methylthiotransferase MtaB
MAVRRERAARLRAAGVDAERRYLDAQIGKTASVLIESDARGRTEQFAPVRLEDVSLALNNEIIDVTIERREDRELLARVRNRNTA